jgi:peptidoglycan-associated lipoprotein
MISRGWPISMVSVLVLAVALVGCAKRPATTQATAPAPTGATGMTAPPPPSTAAVTPSTMQPSTSTPSTPPPAATAQTPPATSRPAVKEFMAVQDLVDIHFDFDKYDVRPNDAKILDTNAQWLKSNADHLLLIEGHCDERGTNEYNLALGERRAKSTMNYLVSQGVQASRITIISYGEERPLCAEHNEQCWSKNRRAHFLVKPR